MPDAVFTALPLSNGLQCIAKNGPWQPSADLERQVGVIWDEESRRLGQVLFDGIIFSAAEYSSEHILGSWIRYRYALAGYKNPELGRELGVLPVAVNGISLLNDQILLGRRSNKVAAFPGKWELAPSGGIDERDCQAKVNVSYVKALYRELQEETGLEANTVEQALPWRLVEDRQVNTLELCMKLYLSPTATDYFHPTSSEYSEFCWLHQAQIGDFLLQHQAAVVPLAEYLLKSLVAAD